MACEVIVEGDGDRDPPAAPAREHRAVKLRSGHQLVRASQVTQMPLEPRGADPGHDLLYRGAGAERLVVDERARDARRRRPQPPAKDSCPRPSPRGAEVAPYHRVPTRVRSPSVGASSGEPADLRAQPRVRP